MGELHGRCHHVSVCVSDLDLVHPHFALWTDDADQTFERLQAAGPQVHDFVSTPNRVEFIGPTRSLRTVRMEEGR